MDWSLVVDWLGREGGDVLSWWLLVTLAGAAAWPLVYRVLGGLPEEVPEGRIGREGRLHARELPEPSRPVNVLEGLGELLHLPLRQPPFVGDVVLLHQPPVGDEEVLAGFVDPEDGSAEEGGFDLKKYRTV